MGPTASPNLLAISFYYPPANNPRAVQVARLLNRVKLPISLVCAGYDDLNDRRDNRLTAQSESFLQEIMRVPFKRGSLSRNAARVAHKVGRPFWEDLPDDSRTWKSAVVQRTQSWFAKRNSQGVLVTFGSPMSDHLIGLELKRRHSMPWLAHFSDPWTDNPFKKFNWLTRNANLSYERSVMESADRLLFTSDETIDLVMAKYPSSLRAKAVVVPHSFEPDQYPVSVESELITVRFLGDMYGPRTPKPLFDALLAIGKERAEVLEGVRFEFVGSMCELDVTQMGYSDLPEGQVVLRESVSNQQSLELMTSADGLMVIDAPADKSVFLPSKLIDYIGAGRPIIGITPPGTASNLIEKLGGWVGDPANKEKTRDALVSFIEHLRLRRRTRSFGEAWGPTELRSSFEAENVGKYFQALVEALSSNR